PTRRARRARPGGIARSCERAHDAGELLRLERRAADERAVDALGLRELDRAARGDAAAIQDRDRVTVDAAVLVEHAADRLRRGGRVLAGRGTTRADGPHRLVRDHETLGHATVAVCLTQGTERRPELRSEDVLGRASVKLVLALADTQHCLQTRAQRLDELLRHALV